MFVQSAVLILFWISDWLVYNIMKYMVGLVLVLYGA